MTRSSFPYIPPGMNAEETVRLYQQALAGDVAVIPKALVSDDMDWQRVKRVCLEAIAKMMREQMVTSNVERLR